MTLPDKVETTKERPAASRLRVWWHHVLHGDGLAGKILMVLLVAGLAAASAWVLVPLRIRPVVPYDDTSLGSFSDGMIKADRDYAIPDEDTTQQKRDEARLSVRAVYDYDATAGDQMVKRVHEAFGLMQRAYGDYRLELARETARAVPEALPEPAPEEGGEQAPEPPPVRRRDAKEDPAAVLSALQARKAEFLQLLQVVLDDPEFEVLVRGRFDATIEKALVTLITDAMRRPLVADIQLVAADRERGIVVRPVPARDTRDEQIVQDVDAKVHDLAAARASITERLPEVMPEAAAEVRAVAGRLARRILRPNLSFNREETLARQDRAAESVKPSVLQVARGEKIIGDGERIERRHLLIFRGMREQAAGLDTLEVRLGGGLLGVLVVLSLFGFARGSVFRFRPGRKDAIFLLVTLMGTLLAGRAGLFIADLMADRFTNMPEHALYYAVPMAASAMLVRLVLSGEYTLVYLAVLSLFAGVLTDGSVGYAAYTFVGGLVVADRVGRARDRSGIWRSGVLMALANVGVVLALQLKEGHLNSSGLLVVATAAIFAGAVTPLLVLGLTYLVEKIFGYTTDLTLLEMANLNNPLLKELVVTAPGTYHHSMMLGAMVDAAAEAIGANPILARVGAYYHDIGKGKNAMYFAENQRGENAHDKLAPSMSVLVIRRHVTDGQKMGRAGGLPQPLIDMIPMHHGTRLMTYFWHKAKEEAERKGEAPPAETDFRHLGPKPRFREAALLMIADSVEAAARTLTEPNADRFRGLVQKVINNCFADGQFDECDITLKDLHAVTRSFVRSLEAIYHTRPEYQQPADKSEAKTLKRPVNGKAKEVEENRPAALAGPVTDPAVPVSPAPEAAAAAPPAPAPAAVPSDQTLEEQATGEALKRLGTS